MPPFVFDKTFCEVRSMVTVLNVEVCTQPLAVYRGVKSSPGYYEPDFLKFFKLIIRNSLKDLVSNTI